MAILKLTTFLSSLSVLTFASAVTLPMISILFNLSCDEKKCFEKEKGKKESSVGAAWRGQTPKEARLKSAKRRRNGVMTNLLVAGGEPLIYFPFCPLI